MQPGGAHQLETETCLAGSRVSGQSCSSPVTSWAVSFPQALAEKVISTLVGILWKFTSSSGLDKGGPKAGRQRPSAPQPWGSTFMLSHRIVWVPPGGLLV